MAKSTGNIDSSLFESLQKIGVKSNLRPYAEVRAEGWVCVDEAAEASGASVHTVRNKLNKAVKDGLWEQLDCRAESGKHMRAFREKA
ncbi:MAG TPA: hypothetical protein DCG72_12305 [Gammaproteobacteria bacterium]|nr:hypothetical protein [Gammaproteobacteria bacterium]